MEGNSYMKSSFLNITWYLYFSVCLLLITPNLAYAEIYQDIRPFDTLGDLKAKFPHAEFEKKYPAWAKDTDAMYSITGAGLSGTITVKFDDIRPFNKKRLNFLIAEKERRESLENQENIKANKNNYNLLDPQTYSQSELETEIELFQTIVNETDETALTVSWVRWIPTNIIPLGNFIVKYGKPDKSGFSDDDMKPYNSWNRGILVTLSDDGKNVLIVEYAFTDEEYANDWDIRYPYMKKDNPYRKMPNQLPQKSKKKITY